MKKTKKHEKINPFDPYEDIVRLEKLDPYETLIKSSVFLKQKKKNLE